MVIDNKIDEGRLRWGIQIKDGESFENAIKRFKKQCEKAGILTELRKREYYEKPSVEKKRKAIAAKRRALKRIRMRQGIGG